MAKIILSCDNKEEVGLILTKEEALLIREWISVTKQYHPIAELMWRNCFCDLNKQLLKE